MSRMVVYMDGGGERHQRTVTLSWGIVAQQNGEIAEIHGARSYTDSKLEGYHENVAFIEACIYATSHGSQPHEIAFVTDDKAVVDANYSIHPENYSPLLAQKFLERTAFLCRMYYTQAVYDLCVECLREASFRKVKGHATTIYNLRADYLAVHARDLTMGPVTPLKAFNDWLCDGFIQYTSNGESFTWYAPFTQLLATLPGVTASRRVPA